MKKYLFQNQTLQEELTRLASDPDRLDLSEELAIARLGLQSCVRKAGTKSLEELSPETLATMGVLAGQVGEVVERISKVERGLQVTLNIEQLTQAAQQIAAIASKYIPAEKAQAFFEEVKALKRRS